MLDSDGFWCIQRSSLSCYTKPSKTMCKMQWCLQDCDGWSAFNERLHSVPRLRPDLPDHCIAHTTLCQILNLLPFQILPCSYFIPSNTLLCPNLISLHCYVHTSYSEGTPHQRESFFLVSTKSSCYMGSRDKVYFPFKGF